THLDALVSGRAEASSSSSVIVLQVHVDSVLATPAEGDPVIAACVHGIAALQPALKSVEPKTRQRQVLRPVGVIEREQEPADALRIWYPELGSVAGCSELLQGPTSE